MPGILASVTQADSTHILKETDGSIISAFYMYGHCDHKQHTYSILRSVLVGLRKADEFNRQAYQYPR